MKKYKFYYDAGHGWLEVTKKELIELGLEDKISGYSYMKDDKVYLEEDCDFELFAKAKGWTPLVWRDLIEEINEEGDSIIRHYEHYHL